MRRSRLLELLEAAATAPLTVVVAPPGSGKTSLVADWSRQSTGPVMWLSLDMGDTDGGQLWTGVVAALREVKPGCGERALARLRGVATLGEAVSELLDELESLTLPTAFLVIDDAHLAYEGDLVAASMNLFTDHLPDWLHVILVGRRDPAATNLPRARARGRLGEIRWAELRFSPGEARELLTRLAPSFPVERVEQTIEDIEGWAAGLQLAALGARSTLAQGELATSLLEGEALIEGYVLREVLLAEAPELVTTLEDVAVVDRVNPGLAEALTGRADAGALLREAEERNVFVTRLGPDGWYRIHPLIRSVLLGDLARRAPDVVTERHARAARWYEQAGETPLALDHWLLAGDTRSALKLLAVKHGELYDSGRAATIRRTIAAIPAGVAYADIPAMLDFAWCHLLVSRHRFLEVVDLATWRAEQMPPPDEATAARLAMLRAIAATMSGRWRYGAELARQALDALADRWWQDPLVRFGWNMVARDAAMSERWDDSDVDIRQAEVALARDPERHLALEGTRALGEALAGRPLDAIRIAAGIGQVAALPTMTILRTEVATAAAIAHRELGDRSRAAEGLEELADTGADPMLYCQILATVELAQARLDDGDLRGARSAFDRAETSVDTEPFGPGVRDWLGRVGTRLALAEGNGDAARNWADQVEDPFWRGIGRARIHLGAGERAEARTALEDLEPRCPRHRVVTLLLQARSATTDEASLDHVIIAAELAASHGMLQSVASEGSEVVEWIERSAWRLPAAWVDRLRKAPSGRSLGALPRLVEPLTERERDVLRFLPSRLTIREIADELYISVNTLKFHLKVIYRKLGVGSRAEAAEAARRLLHS